MHINASLDVDAYNDMGMHSTSTLTQGHSHVLPICHLHEPNYQFWYWRNHQTYSKLKAWQHYYIEATILLKSVLLAFKKKTIIYNPEKQTYSYLWHYKSPWKPVPTYREKKIIGC